MAAKKSWERVDRLDVGDASADVIYHSVGVALSWFEVLQVKMSWLFHLLIGGTEYLAVSRAFGTLEAVPPKANMIRAAADIKFMNDRESREKLGDLMTQFVELSHRRNEIAHAYVSQLTSNGEKKGHFLHPGSHMTNRNTKLFKPPFDPMGDYRYTAAQVAHYTQEFRRLGGDVQSFIDAMQGRSAPGSPQP
jgi:hypothetical protein